MAKDSQLRIEDAPDFFGPKTLGQILGISEHTARDICHVKGFPILPAVKHFVISKSGLVKWLEKNIGKEEQ